MPLTQISLRRGKSAVYHRAIMDGIYRAMRETFAVPEDDRFMTILEHDASTFSYGATYLDIARSDNLVMIAITCNNTRSAAQKAAFYERATDLLAKNPGVRPQDVFINLVEVAPENWSFGNGIGQYIKT